VYGANLAAAGDTVSVLAHGARTAETAKRGLSARDVADGSIVSASVQVVSDPGADAYDVVLVAVTRDQLAAACASLTALAGAPTILLLGNGIGRGAVSGAVRVGGTVDYVRIKPQPLALEWFGGRGDQSVVTMMLGRTRRDSTIKLTASAPIHSTHVVASKRSISPAAGIEDMFVETARSR
jgi:Ketopantoate reductase PanE/ApbA